MNDHRAFVLAQTQVAPVPGIPELWLHQATEAMPLWSATEAFLEAHGAPLPFWAFPWAGGLGLARYILDHPEEVRGLRVLDFAAGSGLVALAALKAGARSAVGVDIDPFAVEAMRLNAALNALHLEASDQDVLEGETPDVDLVVVGDAFYEQPLAGRLSRWLDGLTVPAWVGDPGRNHLPPGMRIKGEVPVADVHGLEGSHRGRCTIWEWGRSQASRG